MPYLRLDLPGTDLVEVKRELARYDLHFDGVTTRQGPNYRDLAAHFTARRHGDLIGVMEPAKRSFPSRGTAVTQTALMTRGVSQLYLSLGDPNADGSLAVRSSGASEFGIY
jgi:cytochrome c-type biogenesis protein CcmF